MEALETGYGIDNLLSPYQETTLPSGSFEKMLPMSYPFEYAAVMDRGSIIEHMVMMLGGTDKVKPLLIRNDYRVFRAAISNLQEESLTYLFTCIPANEHENVLKAFNRYYADPIDTE